MRRATENQRDTRTLTDCIFTKSKVKDLSPCLEFFHQETPKKPSQVSKKLAHPTPRRMLPLRSPKLCQRDRPSTPRHPLCHRRPIHLSGFIPNSPVNIGSSADRPQPKPRERRGSVHHSVQPPGSSRLRLVPVSPANSDITANRSQLSPPSISNPASSQLIRDLSNHSLPLHIRSDELSKSQVTLFNSGSKTVMTQRQESNKAQPSNMSGSTNAVQLHGPPLNPSLKTTTACRLPHSDSEQCSLGNSQRGCQLSSSTHSSDCCTGSTLPIVHNLVAPGQDIKHKRTTSRENGTPDLSHSSQKRCREFEDYDENAKKLCCKSENFSKGQLPRLTGSSLSSQPSTGNSLLLTLSPETTDGHRYTEPTCGQSPLKLSTTFKPTQSCIQTPPSMGAKQAYVKSSPDHILKILEMTSTSNSGEESLTKRSKEKVKRDKSSPLLSLDIPQKNTSSSPHFRSGSFDSGHTPLNTSALPVKALSRDNQVGKGSKSASSPPKKTTKANPCSQTERNKTARSRRPVPVSGDIDELFTPDPVTYVIIPGHKIAKSNINKEMIKSPTTEQCSSRTVASSKNTVSGSLSHKTQNFTGSPPAEGTQSSLPSACPQQISFPTVTLKRVKLENFRSSCPLDNKLLKDEVVKSDGKQLSPLPNNVGLCTLETDTTSSQKTSTTTATHCSKSPLVKRQVSEGGKPVSEEDPIDVELDLGLSFALDLDLSESSHSSEEEQLLSLQEMMERVTKPPDTPEKEAFSNHDGCQSKPQPLPSSTKTGIYKNNLDQMLKEMHNNKRAKEIETQLLNACEEDLLRIAEYEVAEENQEEGVNTEHKEFLQRYSLMSSAIREVPPGEEVFNLAKFGQIFNQDTLQLKHCMVNSKGTAQETLLMSSPAQLKLHVNIGMFQEVYDSHSPCPAQVTRFLFKMMSVHNERMVSEKILQALCDIACTAAYQIVKNGSQKFKVWVPSLADLILVLMNMGAAFVTLFPFENLQPPFTEADLLENIHIKNEILSNGDESMFPEHNYDNILKYLSYCMALCPRAYSDDELLLLLTVVGRVSLDTRLVLQSSVELYPLQYKIVCNIRDWNTMLPRICLVLTDLTDDHHNMCLLVQLLPHNTRGKQLRRHLSLSMISKLLDGSCTYRATEKEIQLSELQPYLPRMQPSALLQLIQSTSSRGQKDTEDMSTLDQQSYYLCYSLLTLANEASNFQSFPAHQKEELLILCSELETHVKCDIRESEKCLYRSKVKDLVARIYTKWQILLQRIRPLHGKLYDYWKPLPVDTLTCSQEEQDTENSDDDEEGLWMEEDKEEEESSDEENEAVISENEVKEEGNSSMSNREESGEDTLPDELEEEHMMDDGNKMGDNSKPVELEGDNTMDNTHETEEVTELMQDDLKQGTQSQVHRSVQEAKVMDEHLEAGICVHTEVETAETSQLGQGSSL